jgi:hypothetical protein
MKNQKRAFATKVQNSGLWARSIQTCRGWMARAGEFREKLMARLAEENEISEEVIRRAMAEAEALACSTQFPLLFLPELAREKVLSARQWAGRQREILERQRMLATML